MRRVPVFDYPKVDLNPGVSLLVGNPPLGLSRWGTQKKRKKRSPGSAEDDVQHMEEAATLLLKHAAAEEGFGSQLVGIAQLAQKRSDVLDGLLKGMPTVGRWHLFLCSFLHILPLSVSKGIDFTVGHLFMFFQGA